MDLRLIRIGCKVYLYGNKTHSYLVRWRGNASAGNQFTIRLHTGDFIDLLDVNMKGEDNIELAPDYSKLFPYNENETTKIMVQNIYNPTCFKQIEIPKHRGFNKQQQFLIDNKINYNYNFGYYQSENQSLFVEE